MPRVLFYVILFVIIYWFWKTYRARRKNKRQQKIDDILVKKTTGLKSKLKFEAEEVEFEEIKKEQP